MKKNVLIFKERKIPRLQKVLRTMKLTTILLLMSAISVFAGKTYSQTIALNLEMKNCTVKEVLRSIEDQSEFYFMYSEKLVDVERELSVSFMDKKIDEVLNEIFLGTDVNYKVKGRYILLTKSDVDEDDIIIQQTKILSGKVTESSGQPLPGVTVLIKGTTQGTLTTSDGEYSLANIQEGAIVQFSFVGH